MIGINKISNLACAPIWDYRQKLRPVRLTKPLLRNRIDPCANERIVDRTSVRPKWMNQAGSKRLRFCCSSNCHGLINHPEWWKNPKSAGIPPAEFGQDTRAPRYSAMIFEFFHVKMNFAKTTCIELDFWIVQVEKLAMNNLSCWFYNWKNERTVSIKVKNHEWSAKYVTLTIHHCDTYRPRSAGAVGRR